MNKFLAMGRITSDPELFAKGEHKFCRFSLAVNRDKENTDFISCVAWDKTAEFITKWFKKGNRMVIEGRLQSSSYTDKKGEKRTAIDVIVQSVEFCENKSKDESPVIPEVVF